MQRAMRASTLRLPVGVIAVGGVALWTGVDDASAASLGSAVTSVGVVATLATLVFVRGWQSHLGGASLPALAGLFALATGAGLLWRSNAGESRWARSPARRRGAVADPPRRAVGLPAGMDRLTLLDELRRHFFELQAAWDLGAREAMSQMTTPEMLEELCAVSSAAAASPQPSEFLTLHAELLLFEERGGAQVVCVEYSGMVREATARPAAPFREFWMLTRNTDASGWRLARHQGLL